ncbi:MAG: DUF3392 domain-containing protein [Gammaproteobacteria bacterium]|nr:DUF3392 domain-containing protein [Gammaproteobacteria bacterium]MDH5694937.1 DUF3392 domain-containing protein [Gammaproteobacteria bacterium]
MNEIVQFHNSIDAWIRQYLLMIAMAQIATLLVVFGDGINSVVRVVMSPYPFLVRMAAFVALCTFGYGAFTALTTPIYANFLATVQKPLLVPIVIASFIVIGMLTEHGLRSRRRVSA